MSQQPHPDALTWLALRGTLTDLLAANGVENPQHDAEWLLCAVLDAGEDCGTVPGGGSSDACAMGGGIADTCAIGGERADTFAMGGGLTGTCATDDAITKTSLPDAEKNQKSTHAPPALRLRLRKFASPRQVEAALALGRRRASREPLQHILGCAPFMDWLLAVDSTVLIPREDSAAVVELALRHMPKGPCKVLDLCCGSGCIGLAIASLLPEARCTFSDIAPPAIALARRNARRLGVQDRCRFVLGDGFAPHGGPDASHVDAHGGLGASHAGAQDGLDKSLAGAQDGLSATHTGTQDGPADTDTCNDAPSLPPRDRYDILVCNPPYIPSLELAYLAPEVRDFEPRLALDGGTSGLNFYRRLATEARPYLTPEGLVCVEFGFGQWPDIRCIFEANGWQTRDERYDLHGVLRAGLFAAG